MLDVKISEDLLVADDEVFKRFVARQKKNCFGSNEKPEREVKQEQQDDNVSQLAFVEFTSANGREINRRPLLSIGI